MMFRNNVFVIFLFSLWVDILSEASAECSIPPQFVDILILQEGFIPNLDHYISLIQSGARRCNDDIRIGLVTYGESQYEDCVHVENALRKLDDFVHVPHLGSTFFKDPIAAVIESANELHSFVGWDHRHTKEGVPMECMLGVIKQLIIIPQDGRPPYDSHNPNVTCMASESLEAPRRLRLIDKVNQFQLLFLVNHSLIPSTEELLSQFGITGRVIGTDNDDEYIISNIAEQLVPVDPDAYFSTVLVVVAVAVPGIAIAVILSLYAWTKYQPDGETDIPNRIQPDDLDLFTTLPSSFA